METFLAEHPQDAYVCSKLGALYMQMGEVEKGQQLLEQGLKRITKDTNNHTSNTDAAIRL